MRKRARVNYTTFDGRLERSKSTGITCARDAVFSWQKKTCFRFGLRAKNLLVVRCGVRLQHACPLQGTQFIIVINNNIRSRRWRVGPRCSACSFRDRRRVFFRRCRFTPGDEGENTTVSYNCPRFGIGVLKIVKVAHGHKPNRST